MQQALHSGIERTGEESRVELFVRFARQHLDWNSQAGLLRFSTSLRFGRDDACLTGGELLSCANFLLRPVF
jgi:hypothetical protein